jgi:hypothetical protein
MAVIRNRWPSGLVAMKIPGLGALRAGAELQVSVLSDFIRRSGRYFL